MITITVQYQFLYSKLEAIQENHGCSLKLVKMVCLWGGGGGSPLHLLPPVWWAGTTGCLRLCAHGGTLSLSYQCLFLLLLLSLFHGKLDGGWKKIFALYVQNRKEQNEWDKLFYYFYIFQFHTKTFLLNLKSNFERGVGITRATAILSNVAIALRGRWK